MVSTLDEWFPDRLKKKIRFYQLGVSQNSMATLAANFKIAEMRYELHG